MLNKFQKKPEQSVVAIQIQLDFEGFVYQKWGDSQTCKVGDWLVNNQGDIYTVDADVFASTYTPLEKAYFINLPVFGRNKQIGMVR